MPTHPATGRKAVCSGMREHFDDHANDSVLRSTFCRCSPIKEILTQAPEVPIGPDQLGHQPSKFRDRTKVACA